MLEQYRIGNLRDEDVQQNKAQMAAADDPFANAPSRHPALIVNQQKPFNAETPLNILGDSFLTPQDLMFVRYYKFLKNHGTFWKVKKVLKKIILVLLIFPANGFI